MRIRPLTMFIALIGLLAAFSGGRPTAANTAAIALVAPAAPTAGDLFEIGVHVSALPVGLSAIELEVRYDPQIIALRGVATGPQLLASGRAAYCPPPLTLAANRARVVCASAGSASGAGTDGTAMRLTFEALTAGSSAVDLFAVRLASDARPPANIAKAVSGTTVAVNALPTAVALTDQGAGPTSSVVLLAAAFALLLLLTVRLRRTAPRRRQLPINLWLAAMLLLQTALPAAGMVGRPASVAAAAAEEHPVRTRHDLPPPRLPATAFFADLNADRRVDANDLRQIAAAWSCAAADGCFSAALDFDGNGVINLFDLATIGNEFDTAPPVITLSEPAEGALVAAGPLRVAGSVSDDHAISTLTINGSAVPVVNGAFSSDIAAADGRLPIHLSAQDVLGQAAAVTRLVTVDGAGPLLTVHAPKDRQAVYTRRPTFEIAYRDLASAMRPATFVAFLTDAAGNHTQIGHLFERGSAGASATLNFNLVANASYTLTARINDAAGNQGQVRTTFYVPPAPATIAPPVVPARVGWVSGVVFDSATCGGAQVYDPLACTGIAGARVTLSQVDPARLAQVRAARTTQLTAARSPFGLPATVGADTAAFADPLAGTVISGPDGFFAFPVAATGHYAVRVEKDGYTYGQRLTDIVLTRSTPTTDIYLTPLDAAVTPCDAAGCQHTSADGQMQLEIPAGAIAAGTTLAVRATQFDQVQYLPSGELPPGTGETYAFNLSGAAEITFTQPVTVMVRNDRGFAPGETIPLGYWNQQLLVWEHAGHANVDGSGDWLVMAVTHFSNFDPNDPVSNVTAGIEGQDVTHTPAENCAEDCDSSRVGLASGALRQSFALPAVNVLGAPQGVALLYDSLRAGPTAFIDIALSLQALADLPLGQFDLVMAELFIEGQKTDQFSFRVDELSAEGEIGRFRYFWDGRDAQGQRLPPGVYFYSVRLKIPYTAQFFFSQNGIFGGPPDLTRPTGVTTTAFIDNVVNGSVLLPGADHHPLGHGWQVAGIQRLSIAEDGSALIDDGNHTLTQYLLPRFDLLDEPPVVRTLRALGAPDAAPPPPAADPPIPPPATAERLTAAATDLPAGRAPATDITADISSDTTWDLVGSPYRLLNDITIQPGATLTVAAGVEVQMVPTAGDIFVRGTLLSQGADGQPVIFTSDDNDPTANGGAEWNGILVDGGTASFDFTTIRYAGFAKMPDNTNTALGVFNGGSVSLRDSLLFRNNDTDPRDDATLSANNGSLTVERTTITAGGLVNANPRYGIAVLGSGPFSLSDSTVEHRITPLRLPWAALAGVATDNTFVTTSPAARFELTGNTLDSDLTLQPYNGLASYYWFGSLTVSAGHTLTLTAGSKLQAQNSGSDLIVRGRLVSAGTPADPVVLTSQADGGNAGEWGGVLIDSGAAADITQTVLRSGGQLTVPGTSINAALAARNATLTLTNSTLFSNGDTSTFNDAPLYLENSVAIVRGVLISDDNRPVANPSHGVILVDGPQMALTFEENTLIQNDRHLKLPAALLPRIAGNNLFNSGDNRRIELSDSVIAGDVTLGPLGGLGTYEFRLDVNVTGHLTLTAGTTLLFDPIADLFITGGTLASLGTFEQPNRIEGRATSWPGIFARNGSAVRLAHTTVREATNALRLQESSARLTDNDFADNERGVRLEAGAVPQFFARANSFANNSAAAVRNVSGRLIDMRLNYWGSPNGPFHPANPGGDGEAIEGGADVLIDPFLSAATIDGDTAVNLTPHDTTLLLRDPADGRFTRHYPDGSRVLFDTAGRHTQTIDAIGNAFAYSYNGDGSLAAIAYTANGRPAADWVWSFGYGGPPAARTVTVSDPAGRQTTLTLDKNGDLAALLEPGLSAPMTFAYGAQHNMTHKTDARGFTTTYEYDASGRLTRSLLPPRELFDPLSGTFSIGQEIHAFAPEVSTAPTVNALPTGSPLAPNPPLPPSGQIAGTQTINGRAYTHTTNRFGAPTGYVDPLGNAVRVERDARDRITRLVSAEGNCTTYSYDDFDNLLTLTQMDAPACAGNRAGLTRTTTYTYEPRFNRLKTKTDPLGRITTYVYDYEEETGAAGLVVRVIYPTVHNENGAAATPEEQYTYNAQGQMLTLTNRRGIVTCFAYTGGAPAEAGTLFAPGVTPVPGLLTQIVEDCGGPQERVTVFGNFTAFGAAQTLTRPGDRTTTMTYDLRGRLTSSLSPLGRQTLRAYDDGDNVTLTVTDATGRPITTSVSYNPLGQPLQRTTQAADQAHTVAYGYDLDRNQTLYRDENGNQTRYLYDADLRLVTVSDALGGSIGYTYDGDDRPLTKTDERGIVTAYTYDGLNRLLTTVIDPAGLALTTAATYDLADNRLTGVDANGTVTCLTYDGWNRPTAVTADCGGLNATRQIEYNLSSMTTAEVDALGRRTAYGFDRLDRPISMTDALGHTFHTVYDAGDRVSAETDMLGRTTQYAYDLHDRRTASTDALGGITTYLYDTHDNLVQLRDPLGRLTVYEYDGLNRRSAATDPTGARRTTEYAPNGLIVADGDARGNRTDYRYDALNRATQTIDALGGVTTFAYDAAGNRSAVTDALGQTQQFAYDAGDRLTAQTDALGRTTTFAWDAVGNQVSVSDPLGRLMTFEYDALYRRTDVTDKAGETTTYSYDLVGNLVGLTDPAGNSHSYTYDALNRLLTQTNGAGATRSFGYDAAGNQTQRSDRNGRVRTFAYDALNRLLSETWVGGDYTATYSYDAAGQLVQATDPAGDYRLEHDAAGRLRRRSEALTGAAGAVDFVYGYDAAGNQIHLVERYNTLQNTLTTTTFDALNRPQSSVQGSPLGGSKQVAYQHDAIGRLTQIARGTGGPPTVTSSYTYDAADRLTALTHQTAAGATLAYTLAYDAGDRLTFLTTSGGSSSYGYDPFDQLLSADHSAPQADESYAYAANGNRAGQLLGPDNRVLDDGSFTYSYDGEGNRTRKTHKASGLFTDYVWDYRNRLTDVVNRAANGTLLSSVSYTYNVFDERVRRSDSSGQVAQFAVANAHVQATLDGSGAIVQRYLHGPLVDLLLVVEAADGTLRYPLADHQLTARDIADGSGAPINRRTYDSFGNLLGESNPAAALAYGHSGREPDALAGLNYHRARYYDPALGRFISEDPLEFLPGDTNLTRYAANQPSRLTDPFGHSSELPDFVQINRLPASDVPLSSLQMSESFFGGVVDNTARVVTAEDMAHAAEQLDNLFNGPAGFRPGNIVEPSNVIQVFNELPTDAQLAAKLADESARMGANKASLLDDMLANRMAGLAGSKVGTLLGIGGALIDYVDAAGNAVAEMYIAQARIMAHERVEAHRAEMERRQLAIHNERTRKHNEEVRRQLREQREAEHDAADARKAQEIQQDAAIIQQALREQQFLEEQRNRRRGRGGGSAPAPSMPKFNFDTLQWEYEDDPWDPSKPAPTTQGGNQPLPPSNTGGLVGLAQIALQRQAAEQRRTAVTMPDGSDPRNNCLPR